MRNSHDLVGRSLAQTLNLLGEPDRLTYGGDLVYVLGPDPNYGIDIWELHIKFGKYGIVQATTIESY
jgi:hypothetical protein